MRESILVKLAFGMSTLIALAGVPVVPVGAHEGHQMECNETNLNAISADIQAIQDENVKTTAIKELEMAKDMMAEKNMKSCEAHLHNAMEAMEK
jgi:hypothetical protein